MLDSSALLMYRHDPNNSIEILITDINGNNFKHTSIIFKTLISNIENTNSRKDSVNPS